MPSREETVLDATLRAGPTLLLVHGRRLRHLPRPPRVGRGADGPQLRPRAEEVAAGIVLACQSHPVTDEVSLDYDA